MQRAGIGFPMKFHGRARYFRIDIVRLDGQRAIQHRFFFSVAPERSVTERNLLKRENVARVEINRALQIAHRLFPAALAALDVTFQLEYPRHHWAGSGAQLPVQPERRHNRGILDKDFPRVPGVLRPHQGGGETPPEWPLPPRPGAQEYGRSQGSKGGHEYGRVGNTLGKTMDHARQPGSADRPPAANSLSQFLISQKIFGASVELEGGDVARRGTFDCALFAWRKFGLQADRQSPLRSHSESRIHPQDRGHKSAPIVAGRFAHRPTAR